MKDGKDGKDGKGGKDVKDGKGVKGGKDAWGRASVCLLGFSSRSALVRCHFPVFPVLQAGPALATASGACDRYCSKFSRNIVASFLAWTS